MARESYADAAARAERWELAPGDAGYPEPLLDLEDRAPVLRGIGDKDALSGDCISIVGARLATPYGIACARMAGRVAAECGVTVVSGGARGCDHEAGAAAVGSGGRTVVIPGCGADVVYPRSSEGLFADAVSGHGCVVSLERWGAPPRKYAFVRRNEVIAALSASLVVCEAGRPSGTFGTATRAAELGRRVYAVPGSIFSPTSRGTNWLIESGAAVVCDEQSLEGLVALDYGRLRFSPSGCGKTPKGSLASALAASPMTPDEVAALMGTDLPRALAELSAQELAGLVVRLGDGRYMASAEALLAGG